MHFFLSYYFLVIDHHRPIHLAWQPVSPKQAHSEPRCNSVELFIVLKICRSGDTRLGHTPVCMCDACREFKTYGDKRVNFELSVVRGCTLRALPSRAHSHNLSQTGVTCRLTLAALWASLSTPFKFSVWYKPLVVDLHVGSCAVLLSVESKQ